MIGDAALDLLALRDEIVLGRQTAYCGNLGGIDAKTIFGESGGGIAKDFFAERVVGTQSVKKRIELRCCHGIPLLDGRVPRVQSRRTDRRAVRASVVAIRSK